MKCSLEMPVADGRTYGHANGTEFMGPLSALPGVRPIKKKANKKRMIVLKEFHYAPIWRENKKNLRLRSKTTKTNFP